MERKDYFYPDIDDKITASLMKEREPFEGYWEKSEKKVLNLIKESIQEHVKKTADSWFLDAGCGTGRLLPKFERHFNHILAIDPDPTQIKKAKSLVKKGGFAHKVVFQVTSIEKLDWRKESIDVILCSHILQHVQTDSVPLILRKFEELTKKEGLLFIMATHSREKCDYYVKEYLENSKVVEERIEKEEFNSLIFNEKNILPLRFFSRKSIIKELENSGFVLLDFRSFHVLGKASFLDKIIDRDRLVNSVDFLKTRLGRDILVTSRKTS
ncbi:MAG: class I SAM-dependent methyltransferase [Candidatus Bathyarchaeota archaeon]|nr:class I SAM-dependent methyltransferase [Candidatus Bathyarchaeota archaeon]